MDDRLRSGLREDVSGIEPDVEQHLAAVKRSVAPRSLPTSGLVVVAVAFAAIAFIGTGAFRPVAELVGLLEPQPAVVPEAPTDADEPAAALDGVYSAGADGTEEWPTLAGDWTLSLGADSSLALRAPAAFIESTDAQTSGYVYGLRGDLLFTNLFTRGPARGCAGPGTYRWALTGDRLSFELVEDTCILRTLLLTGQPWRRIDG
jgi:hypothetical protein